MIRPKTATRFTSLFLFIALALTLAIGLLTQSGPVASAQSTDSGLPPAQLFLSPRSFGVVGNITYTPEDVLIYDTASNSWELFFSGAQFGLPPANIDAILLLGNRLVVSFEFSADIPGINGTVQPEDLVVINLATGAIGRAADFSDVGLGGSMLPAENVDAITVGPDGNLLVNTAGDYQIPPPFGGLSGDAGDILEFHASSYGNNTQGNWTRFFNSPPQQPAPPQLSPAFIIAGISLGCDGNYYVVILNGPSGPGVYQYNPMSGALVLFWPGVDGFDGGIADGLIANLLDCSAATPSPAPFSLEAWLSTK